MLALCNRVNYTKAMSPQDVVIDMKGLSKRYGYGDAESYALRDFDLTVKRGEFVMIMGPSGCGKTTLLNIIGLLDKPTEGEYLLNGVAVEKTSEQKKARLRAKKIGVIFQDFNLIPRLTVLENVTLPLTYAGYTKTHRNMQADKILERFHLQEREYYMPYQLSGGQQQRVAIARSLVADPEIILADEPTGNLDSRSSHVVMEELREIHSAGNTIIMVTHNPALTAYATRVINMLDGQIDTDIKTVADRDLPQPVSVHFRRRKILKEVKDALVGNKNEEEEEEPEESENSEEVAALEETKEQVARSEETADADEVENEEKGNTTVAETVEKQYEVTLSVQKHGGRKKCSGRAKPGGHFSGEKKMRNGQKKLKGRKR